ncbi:hypothetical protein KN1_07920 [Stygiolobus caldivivus]|uniref:Uncharacterized protein n=1 Tax=Stygiolobus caldivivus TaxID=2824673 RepID=A0A8D5ZIL1_9CREN|nr:hypothetical protein KN1_07920 [Stygiolobus caldivivus]
MVEMSILICFFITIIQWLRVKISNAHTLMIAGIYHGFYEAPLKNLDK